MRPPPALIMRTRVSSLHDGQVVKAGADMGWSSSKVYLHSLHRYSYVGISDLGSYRMVSALARLTISLRTNPYLVKFRVYTGLSLSTADRIRSTAVSRVSMEHA